MSACRRPVVVLKGNLGTWHLSSAFSSPGVNGQTVSIHHREGVEENRADGLICQTQFQDNSLNKWSTWAPPAQSGAGSGDHPSTHRRRNLPLVSFACFDGSLWGLSVVPFMGEAGRASRTAAWSPTPRNCGLEIWLQRPVGSTSAKEESPRLPAPGTGYRLQRTWQETISLPSWGHSVIQQSPASWLSRNRAFLPPLPPPVREQL